MHVAHVLQAITNLKPQRKAKAYEEAYMAAYKKTARNRHNHFDTILENTPMRLRNKVRVCIADRTFITGVHTGSNGE